MDELMNVHIFSKISTSITFLSLKFNINLTIIEKWAKLFYNHIKIQLFIKWGIKWKNKVKEKKYRFLFIWKSKCLLSLMEKTDGCQLPSMCFWRWASSQLCPSSPQRRNSRTSKRNCGTLPTTHQPIAVASFTSKMTANWKHSLQSRCSQCPSCTHKIVPREEPLRKNSSQSLCATSESSNCWNEPRTKKLRCRTFSRKSVHFRRSNTANSLLWVRRHSFRRWVCNGGTLSSTEPLESTREWTACSRGRIRQCGFLMVSTSPSLLTFRWDHRCSFWNCPPHTATALWTFTVFLFLVPRWHRTEVLKWPSSKLWKWFRESTEFAVIAHNAQPNFPW